MSAHRSRRRLSASVTAAGRLDAGNRVALTGGLMPSFWILDDRGWADRRRPRIAIGQHVGVALMDRSQMAHPVRLHGITSRSSVSMAGTTRDTVLVTTYATMTITFDTSNPERRPLHPHTLLHMAIGMMTEASNADVGQEKPHYA